MHFLRRLFGGERSEAPVAQPSPRSPNACPHCGFIFRPPPLRKKKCPECGEAVFVRTRRLLLTEAESEDFDKQPKLEGRSQNIRPRSVVLFASRALVHSRRLFLFDYVNARLPGGMQYVGVELYVGLWLAVSAIMLFVIPFDAPQWLFVVAVVFALYRLSDVYSTQLRIVLVDIDDPAQPGVLSLSRNIILTIANFLELLLVFAWCFRTIERLSESYAFEPELTSSLDSLLLSVSIATTSGFTDNDPIGQAAKIASIAEVLLAAVLLAVVLSIFLSSKGAIKERQ